MRHSFIHFLKLLLHIIIIIIFAIAACSPVRCFFVVIILARKSRRLQTKHFQWFHVIGCILSIESTSVRGMRLTYNKHQSIYSCWVGAIAHAEPWSFESIFYRTRYVHTMLAQKTAYHRIVYRINELMICISIMRMPMFANASVIPMAWEAIALTIGECLRETDGREGKLSHDEINQQTQELAWRAYETWRKHLTKLMERMAYTILPCHATIRHSTTDETFAISSLSAP